MFLGTHLITNRIDTICLYRKIIVNILTAKQGNLECGFFCSLNFFFSAAFSCLCCFQGKIFGDFHVAAAELNTFIGTSEYCFPSCQQYDCCHVNHCYSEKPEESCTFPGFCDSFLAALFMMNKYFEWSHKFEFQTLSRFGSSEKPAQGELLFFGLYYMMTGLHALHVLIGMILLSINLVKIKTGTVNQGHYLHLENSALYWHLVDLIWIFLFPLLYLIT